jgi:hypothetical protein
MHNFLTNILRVGQFFNSELVIKLASLKTFNYMKDDKDSTFLFNFYPIFIFFFFKKINKSKK